MDSQNTPERSHKISLASMSATWHNGLPLGNGVIGAMVWGDGSPLNFTLDHAELWDFRENTDYMRDPAFNYDGLRRLIEKQEFEKAHDIFERRQTKDNPIGPTKISIGRASLNIGQVSASRCELDVDSGIWSAEITI